MPRRVFTPNVIAQMRQMAEAGHSAREIAGAIGSTDASVRVKCCALKIGLRGGGNGGRGPQPTNEDRRSFEITIGIDVFDRLKAEAEKRGLTPRRLARRILHTVLCEDMVNAVLDDALPETPSSGKLPA